MPKRIYRDGETLSAATVAATVATLENDRQTTVKPKRPAKSKKSVERSANPKKQRQLTGGTKTRKKLAEGRRANFLRLLAVCGNVSRSAQGAGMTDADRINLYRIRRQDAEFAEAWDEAAAMGVMSLEDEMRRRAFEGVEEPVIYKGQVAVDKDGNPLVVRKFSDNLLMFALKGAKPDKYRDKPAVLSANASAASTANASAEVEIQQGRDGMYADLVKRARDRENAN